MALYIRDDKVDKLAKQLAKATAQSKTAAVREALETRLADISDKTPLLQRIRPILKQMNEIGPVDPEFDMKEFTDDMWGEE